MTGRAGTTRAGFTVIELMFSLTVIFLIMGLLLVGLRYAVRSAKGAVDTVTTNSLKTALDRFKQEFGFFPPLVKDLNNPAPVTGAPKRPVVCAIPADLAFLRGDAPPNNLPDTDLRFTVYGLAYYVIGALAEDVDGRAGPGFTTPTADGGFTKKGRKFDPFFDTSRNARAVLETDLDDGLVELRDGNNLAFRYYRWLHDAVGPVAGEPINEFLNVPDIVGDPETRLELRNAEWAIVAAGRDGVFGDEYTLVSLSHPQALTEDEMGSRLGMSLGSLGLAQYQAALRKKAKEDNIVVIGGSK